MIADIKRELDVIASRDISEGGLDDLTWTTEIFRALGELGHRLGYKVCSSGGAPPANWNQFIYDHCWLQYDENKCLTSIPLVLESEWSRTNNIDDDFQKLLVSNADLRVMIFQKTTAMQVNELFDEMERWTAAFRGMSSQQFLLCGWSIDPRKLNYRTIQ